MALLMRRLFVDAQAKLRRMVEEHSIDITSRIDSDYPSNSNLPVPHQPSSAATCLLIHEIKIAEGAATTSTATSSGTTAAATATATIVAAANSSSSSSSAPSSLPSSIAAAAATNHVLVEAKQPSLNGGDEAKVNDCDLDVSKLASENKLTNFKSSRPNSVDAKRTKSLSVELTKESTTNKKKDVKKTKSSDTSKPVAEEQHLNGDGEQQKIENDVREIEMTIQESTSPLKDSRSSLETRSDSPKPGCSSQPDIDSSSPRSPRSSDGARDPAEDRLSLLPSPSSSYRNKSASSTVVARRLKQENDRLQAEVTRLKRLVVSGATTVLAERRGHTTEGVADVQTLEAELLLAREALATLKADKRRLKAEKFDLLNQMKQLYLTLEDKEKELRDFIRSYGQARDNETSLQQLSTEREERERERWSLLRHARDEAERSLSLAAQLNAKELQLQRAQEQLMEARRQLASGGCLSDQESLASLPRHCGGALTPGSLIRQPPGGSGSGGGGGGGGDRGSCSADSGVRLGGSDRESAASAAGNLSDSTTDGAAPTITLGSGGEKDLDAVSLASTATAPPPHMYQSSTKDCSPTLSPLNANNFSRSVDPVSLSSYTCRSVEQLSSPLEPEPITVGRRNKPSSRPSSGRGGTWGSISRVFARSRHRNKTNSLQETSEHGYEPYRSWSPLTEEGYAEKLRLLREASSIPMDRWRASTVLAWLEVALGMPQYGARCAENIKSGKIGPLHGQVLLELSDVELECGLGITHPMHRKKVRLAIEEHRHPALVRYPCIAQLGHTWVSSEWLPDLGLAQYSENFASNMVDARMLEHLSKKELEKYLGVTRKFHQASIVHGIHLLRIMKYDRQALAVRRHQCENMDADPLVWTNQRFIRWARSIDLAEYADNLKDSGVHGGLVVLEPSFNGDTMATALGIPASKNIIRRHLTAELDSLILPARSTLEHYVRVRASTKSRVLGGSLGRQWSRSCGGLGPSSITSTASTASRRDSTIKEGRSSGPSIRVFEHRRGPEF